MCGIAGIVGAGGDERDATVRAMTRAIAHRGPDDEGFWSDAGCALGHRRLSIIDLSAAGHQPMANEDGAVQLVFNGEIYAWDELRRRLEAAGHTFRSRTDSEVIVHLYEEHGDDFVRHLRGMFALALWDARRRRLILARDRFGQKPLFWAPLAGGGLAFASEIKALLAAPGVDRSVDDEGIDRFLALHFVPAPHTLHRGIRRLPAASLLVVEDGREPHVTRYWNLGAVPARDLPFDEAVDAVDAELTRATKEQLVADVPVGLFLSGGIDSTLVLAKVAEQGARLDTFSIGFTEPQFSELDHARVVAERFGVPFHPITMSAADARDPEKLLDLFDEPFADPAAIPQVHLSRAARARVKVALTGDGGDELFGGYAHHVLGYWLARTPFPRARAVASRAALRLLPRRGRMGRARALRRGVETLAHADWLDALVRLRSTLQPEARASLYTADFLARVPDEPYDALLPDARPDRLFNPAGDQVLADQFLMKADLASMSVALECRSPFLDPLLAELAVSLPSSHKVSGRRGKRILRRLLERKVPREIWARPKMGLAMPVEEWLRADLAPLFTDTVLRADARVAAYVRIAEVRRLFDEHRRAVANHRRILWALLLLELWLRRQERPT